MFLLMLSVKAAQHIEPTNGQSKAQGLAVLQGPLAGYDVHVTSLSDLVVRKSLQFTSTVIK
jgi:hypothetical protein